MAISEDAKATLGQALARYVEARSAALLTARRALKINEMDARALLYVASHPGTRPTDVREHLGITSAGVTALIDRLVDRDAVRRDLDENDRRANRIFVTVDMTVGPWVALTQFDADFDQAVDHCDPIETDRFACMLDELTESLTAR